MLKKLLLSLAALLILNGCTANNTNTIKTLEDKVLTIGLDDTFAPMGFIDDNGDLVGFDIDLAKETAKILNVDVEFIGIDWSMKETELETGNIDCIWNGFSISEERKRQILFSDPYLENRQIIITLADSSIKSKNDLQGKVVSVQKESSALQAVSSEENILSSLKQLVEFDTNIDCFIDLEAERSDAIVVDEVLARYVMKQRGEERYKVLDDNFGTEDYAIGFRLNDDETVNKVNDALKQMIDDGTYDSIYKKWFAQ
ncbi:MAG: amino acid ABC transporter substrate-binding protein [Erysipelotrichaceae bacterium]|nr:amino acid ABC transporter substrate-binding protein [Erysipelotrichaceae bacterium]MDY5251676.1 amino acid ABC transporter substrate-binding protein [Erysipelotrichaceae bacterium]